MVKTGSSQPMRSKMSLAVAMLFTVVGASAQDRHVTVPLGVVSHLREVPTERISIEGVPPLIGMHAEKVVELALDTETLKGVLMSVEDSRRVIPGGPIAPLSLRLDSNLEVIATVSHVRLGPDGTKTLHGQIETPAKGWLTLSMSNDDVFGTVEFGLRRFVIQSAESRRIFGKEVSVANLGRDLDLANKTVAKPDSRGKGAARSKVFGDRVLDIMVLFTPAAASAMGNPATVINNLVSNLDQSFINSGVDGSANLVHSQEWDEVDDPATDEEFIGIAESMPQGVDGNFGDWTGLADLRDLESADIVVLLVADNGEAICGVANRLRSDTPSGDEWEVANAVVSVACSATDHTFSHEVGHILGGAHEPWTYSGDPAILYPVSFGFSSSAGNFRTLMGSVPNLYGSGCSLSTGCPRINYWSNPDDDYWTGSLWLPLGWRDFTGESNMFVTLRRPPDFE